jgi:hypothetical protein
LAATQILNLLLYRISILIYAQWVREVLNCYWRNQCLLSVSSSERVDEILRHCYSIQGVRLYTRRGMGMPGSETSQEEIMCRLLGDRVQAGFASKLADDLYCG